MTEAMPHRECGTMCVHRRLLNDVPQYQEARRRIEDHALQSQMRLQSYRGGIRRIPVVIHVIYNSPTENVSQEQADSQIDVLNRDFRMSNPDISQVPAPFQPLAGDTRIEFHLAAIDPDGNATNGVTRTRTSVSAFDADDLMKFTSSEGKDAWPSDRYLNIWVCKLDGGLLGYAQFPGGPMATDGVVITHTAFGTTGSAQAPFNKGRTATHEIGHWLNLYHIWGDDGQGCAGSDVVPDTPNQGGPNYNVPTFPTVSCGNGPNGDMFMNYMDYVDDAAMVMFTQGQISRMMATLDFDGPRASIGETAPEVTSPQNAALIAYYQNVLMYYFYLHQRGLLDYQGYLAWQNAYASYAQLSA